MNLRAIACVLGGVFFAQASFADIVGDAAQGRKVSSQCKTCHGSDGFARIPIAPHIGGEPADYISKQLKAFREGTRSHEIMTVIARGMDDQAIADVAAWYASHSVTATLADTVTSENAPELCSGCHGAAGISEIEDAPNLAGESVMYIDTQLKAFRNGRRTSEIMGFIASELSDEDIREVSEWYSNVELTVTKDADSQ